MVDGYRECLRATCVCVYGMTVPLAPWVCVPECCGYVMAVLLFRGFVSQSVVSMSWLCYCFVGLCRRVLCLCYDCAAIPWVCVSECCIYVMCCCSLGLCLRVMCLCHDCVALSWVGGCAGTAVDQQHSKRMCQRAADFPRVWALSSAPPPSSRGVPCMGVLSSNLFGHQHSAVGVGIREPTPLYYTRRALMALNQLSKLSWRSRKSGMVNVQCDTCPPYHEHLAPTVEFGSLVSNNAYACQHSTYPITAHTFDMSIVPTYCSFLEANACRHHIFKIQE